MNSMPEDSVHPLTLSDWRTWLQAHHLNSRGIWLVTNKKATGLPRVEYEQAVEEALCWGWIDSVTRGLDEQRGLLRFTPRKRGSGWSKSNKERLLRLTAEGRISPYGQAVIDAAIADGSWTKLDEVETRTVPADLAQEFDRYSEAAARFDAFPSGEKRRILEWISQAKTAPTRTKRIEETARLAQDNVRANLWTKGGRNNG